MATKSSETLAKRKKPKDDAHRLNFSITRNVIHHDDYGALVNKRGFKHKKTNHEKELEDEVRRQGFWQTLKEELEKTEAAAIKNEKGFIAAPTAYASENNVKITKRIHKKSPYVVKLTSAKGARLAGGAPTKPADNDWKDEMERLRKEAKNRSKDHVQKVRVNFLKVKRFTAARPENSRKFKLESLFTPIKRLPAGAGLWLFEFILSIPLGFLLFIHLLLKIVDRTGALASRGGRAVGRSVFFLIEETFLGLLTLVKAVVVIPLKLAILGCLVVYRLVAGGGAALARGVKEALRVVKNFFLALARAPVYFLKRALTVALVAFIVLAPLKFISQSAVDARLARGRVLGSAREALAALGRGADSFKQGQAIGAAEPLKEAGIKFSEAHESLNSMNLVLRGIMKLTPQGQGAEALLTAGEELIQAGQYIAAAIAPFVSQTERPGDVITAINNLSSSLTLAAPHLRGAREELTRVDQNMIPETYRERFASMRNLLPAVEESVNEFIGLAGQLTNVLGGSGERRYVVLFQNNNELRPAGGFIGSLALIKVSNGRLTKIDVPGGGSYDFQGSLEKQVLSPKPLSLINAQWQLQDANWYPDWPTSAEKVAWFLENSGESSVDGVIAVQATVLQKLLAILGPIEFPEYKETLTADNVIKEIQTAVEVEYDKTENKPKQYIGELAPRVIDKILESTAGQFKDLFGLVQQGVAEKEILFYFRDPELNQEFIERGWEPTIINTDLDYLSIIHANIGGGKTDGVIEESWQQRIIIDDDGTAEAELIIKRYHHGNPTDAFEKFNNVDFVRVYAPEGSELISASGFNPPSARLFEKAEPYLQPDEELSAIEGKVIIDEASGTRINNEFGKTVFGNWMQVKPGSTALATFRYKLPFKIRPFSPFDSNKRGGYSLLIQKQAGARPIDYEVSIDYPVEWGINWKKISGEATLQTGAPGLAVFSGILTKDSGFGLLFTKGD